mgnify:FL=1
MKRWPRPWGRRRRSLALPTIVLALIVSSSPLAAQNLRLQLAPRPVPASSLSLRGEALQLTVQSGAAVHFSRARGRDYRLRAGGGLTWTQIEEVPRSAESMTLRPLLRDDGSVEVAVSVTRKQESQLRSFSSTLQLQPGRWQRLYGPAGAAPGTRVYRTPDAPGDSLYLRVDTDW